MGVVGMGDVQAITDTRFRGEWENRSLRDLADCLDHVRVPLNEAQRRQMPGPYPYCGANGVVDHIADYVLDDDVILIAEDGGHFGEHTDRPIAYRMKGKIWVNNHAHVLKAKPGFSQAFLFFALVHKDILPFLASGTRSKLNRGEMNKIAVRLPKGAAEQRAIAAVLSDVDELIGSLEALIAKKRAIKQAAMQELLTGRTRLPGFGGEWEEGSLGLIAQLHREHVVPDPAKKTPYMHFSLPAYDAGQRPGMEHGEAIRSGKFRVRSDAILLSRLNPRIPRVWAPTCVGPNSVASTEFLVITPKAPTVRAFLYYQCSSPEFWERMVLAVTGTTGSHQRVKGMDAMQLLVRYPRDSREQRAIATVLSDMDSEITALKHRLDKTRAIKQGMMQQLLTGSIRLPIPDSDTDAAHDA